MLKGIPINIGASELLTALSILELHELYDVIDTDDFCSYKGACGLKKDHDPVDA